MVISRSFRLGLCAEVLRYVRTEPVVLVARPVVAVGSSKIGRGYGWPPAFYDIEWIPCVRGHPRRKQRYDVQYDNDAHGNQRLLCLS